MLRSGLRHRLPRKGRPPVTPMQSMLESIVELKTVAQASATLIVVTEMMNMLRRKGLLDDADIEGMLRKLEAISAATSEQASDTSKCVADAALSLRHAFFEETGKAN